MISGKPITLSDESVWRLLGIDWAMTGIGAGEDPRGAAVPCRGTPILSWLLEVESEGNTRLRVDSVGNARLRVDTGGYCQMPDKKGLQARTVRREPEDLDLTPSLCDHGERDKQGEKEENN